MNYQREIAGVGVVISAALLIWKEQYDLALYLLLPLLGFIIGEKNGEKTTLKEIKEARLEG